MVILFIFFALQILSSLRVLLTLSPMDTPIKLLRQISNGLHEIVQSNSGHISSTSDWSILISVMKACSAGARHLPRLMSDGPSPLRDSPTSKGSSTADASFCRPLKTFQRFSSLLRQKNRRLPTTLTCGRLKHSNGTIPSRCSSLARHWHSSFEMSG